jgi:hypothetical protein
MARIKRANIKKNGIIDGGVRKRGLVVEVEREVTRENAGCAGCHAPMAPSLVNAGPAVEGPHTQ